MSDTADMLGLLTAARSPCETIARRGVTAISLGEFSQRVGTWRNLLNPLKGRAFALFEEDSVEFAAALYGGWLAGKVMKGRGFGLIGDVAIGVVGALLGGFVASNLLKIAAPLSGFNLETLVTAFAGSILVILILRLLNGGVRV